MIIVVIAVLISQWIFYLGGPFAHSYLLWILPILCCFCPFNIARKIGLGFCIGLLSASAHDHWFAPADWPKSTVQKPIQVQARVLEVPEVYADFTRVTLGLQNPPGFKVRVRWYERAPKMQAGEVWQLNLKLRPRRGRLNPGAFDLEKSLYANGISAEGYVVENPNNHKLKEAPWWSWGHVRGVWYDRLKTALPDNPMSGFIPALSLGLRDGIQPEQWHRLQSTGTAHLLAISGLHIGLLAGFAWKSLNFLSRRFTVLLHRYKSQQFAWIGALLIAIAYSACAGFALPTLRAVLTLAISIFLRLKGWHQPWYWIFALVVTIICVIEPFAILKPGFWLSCGAVMIILLLTQQKISRANAFTEVTKMQTGLFFGMLPLSVIVLHQLSFSGLMANLIAVPWTSLIVTPLAILSTITVLFSKTFAYGINWLADWALQLQWWFLAVFDWPSINAIGMKFLSNPWAYAALLLSGLILCLPWSTPARWSAIIPLSCCFLMKNPAALAEGDLRLTVLDVGQGLAAVVQTTNHTLLFDTGPTSLAGDAGDFVVVPFLRYNAVPKIDALVLTHGDLDHRGGLESTLRFYKVDQLWASNLNDLKPFTGQRCQNGIRWTWDQVTFQFLHPDIIPIEKGNNQSCVLQIVNKNNRILLTGDIEREAEIALVQRLQDKLQSDILIAAHHGSQSSSTKVFLNAVKPKIVIIPVGYMNRYRHPSQIVVKRFHDLGANIYNIARVGSLTVTIPAQTGMLRLLCMRADTQPRWRVDQLMECKDA